MITYSLGSVQAVYLQKRCEEVLAALPPWRRKFLESCRVVITDDARFNPAPHDPTLLGAHGGLRAHNIIHVIYLNPLLLPRLRCPLARPIIRKLLHHLARRERLHRYAQKITV